MRQLVNNKLNNIKMHGTNVKIISYQFTADVQTYGHRPRYTTDKKAAEIDVSAQKCQVVV